MLPNLQLLKSKIRERKCITAGYRGKLRQIFKPEEKCEDFKCCALIVSTGIHGYLKYADFQSAF